MAAASSLGRGLLVALLLLAPLASQGAAAQGLQSLAGGDEPLEIEAEEGIEWHRDSQLYIARGNARARRGEITVRADLMTAHYGEGEGGNTDIDRIEIHGAVEIASPTERAYGDHGSYDVAEGVFILTGTALRMETAEDLVTARDSLEYWERKRVAVARGDAEAQRADKRIKADVLTAYFEPDAANKLQLVQVEARGNVQIATASEFARGDEGVYDVTREFATLTGSVKISRGDNQLNGAYAEFDLTKGVSRLLAAPPGQDGTGRVHGLIVPRSASRAGSEESKEGESKEGN